MVKRIILGSLIGRGACIPTPGSRTTNHTW